MIRVSFYLPNLFLNNSVVYCRILFTFFLSSLFDILKKPILKTYPPQIQWFSTMHSNSVKKLSAILHIQFNHHALPVAPFKSQFELITLASSTLISNFLIRIYLHLISKIF